MKNSIGRFLIKRLWSRNMAKKSLSDMVFDESSITDEEVDRMWDFSKHCIHTIQVIWMQCSENLEKHGRISIR